ncbi:MAG: hypothetical protein RL297_501 [Pseudomonadota bacterium]|jgi:hypothetical protein
MYIKIDIAPCLPDATKEIVIQKRVNVGKTVFQFFHQSLINLVSNVQFGKVNWSVTDFDPFPVRDWFVVLDGRINLNAVMGQGLNIS